MITSMPFSRTPLIGRDLVPVLDLVLPLWKQRVLRRDDHIGHAEEGIGTGGVDGHVVRRIGLEGDFAAGGAADPVLLLDLDALDIVQVIQIVDQAVGIGRDAQHPLALLLADDLSAAALAHAVDDLFVRQADLAAGAPVDGHRGLVGQTVLEHLQEDPLGPLVVLRVGGIDATIPVEAVTQHLQLAGEVGNVVPRDDRGMDVVLDGEVFGRKAEGVIADGENDVVAVHALFARDDIHRGKGTRMAHVKAGGAGIRELNQAVELGPRVAGDRGIGLGLFPLVLPFFLYRSKIIFHVNTSTSIY